MAKAALLMIFLFVCIVPVVWGEDGDVGRVEELEAEVSQLQGKVRNLESKMNLIRNNINEAGYAAFLFGIFCAWWAQHTNRNAWLWFFLGLIFSVITGIVLLCKNSDDRKKKNYQQFFNQQTGE